MAIELGKPADYGQFILHRRYQLAKTYAREALARGGIYLDVGCGNGAQTILFVEHFDIWTGIDVEEKRLEEFRRVIAQTAIDQKPHEILLYDGEKIPATNNSVDFLTCIEVIEHTASDKHTIEELFRVLKPNGTALITVPNKWWIFETHGANLPLLPWNRVPFFSWLPKKIHDKFAKARIYRKPEIEQLMTSAGFTIEQSLYVTAPMDMIKQENLQKTVRSLAFRNDRTGVPFLATSVMLIARKSAETPR